MAESRKRLTEAQNLRLRYVVACHLLPKYASGQSELGPLLGVKQPTLSGFLVGRQGSTIEMARRVSNLLDTPLDALFSAGWYPAGGEESALRAALQAAGFPQPVTGAAVAEEIATKTVERTPRYQNIELAIAYNESTNPARWSSETIAAGRATALHLPTDRDVRAWESYLDDLEKSIRGARSAFDGPTIEPSLESTAPALRKAFLAAELEKLGKAAFKEKYGAGTVAAALKLRKQ